MQRQHHCLIGLVCLFSLGGMFSDPAIGARGKDSELLGDNLDIVDPAKDTDHDLESASLFDENTSEGLDGANALSIGSFGQIDIHVKDLEITKVLQLLSIQSQRNIIASRNVAGAISADLYGVDFYDAMDAILHPNGFGFQEKGKFIYVYTVDELKQMAEAEVKMSIQIVRLNYIPAIDAVKFVKPLLSPSGSVSVSAPAGKGIQPTLSNAGENAWAHHDTLMVKDIDTNVAQIVTVLKQLDVRPAQVLVEATILEARLTEANAFGVDMTILADLNIEMLSNPLSSIANMIDGVIDGAGQAFETTVGQTNGGNSGVRVGFIDNDVAAFIKALDSVTDTTVLANPKILVLNRHRAEILVGERLGYISTVQTETSETQTIEFLDIGTQLTVRPFVSDDGFIRLELRPSISDGSTELVGGFVIPNTTNEEMVTNILVRDAQTVVMGGLFKEDTDIARRQVPFLGNMPIAQWAFRGQDDTVARSEVIFLIKPTIQKDQVMIAEGERVNESIHLARYGAPQELLPWSRSKLVASRMRDALAHQQAGRQDMALWHVNMALILDPNFVAGMRLKGQLTSERMYWPQRSILKDATDHVINQRLSRVGQKPAAAPIHPDLKAPPIFNSHAGNSDTTTNDNDVERSLYPQADTPTRYQSTKAEIGQDDVVHIEAVIETQP